MTTFVYESTLANGAAVDSALGKAETALQDAEVFATAAQGALADTAVQPGDLGSAAAALGLSDTQLDDLFALAATL